MCVHFATTDAKFQIISLTERLNTFKKKYGSEREAVALAKGIHQTFHVLS